MAKNKSAPKSDESALMQALRVVMAENARAIRFTDPGTRQCIEVRLYLADESQSTGLWIQK